MKHSLEPSDGDLGGNYREQTPLPKQVSETAEQPLSAGIIIERSLGQIKAEKEAVEGQIKKLAKLVETPGDIAALENLQNRADRLAEEYTQKLADLNNETEEVTEVGVPFENAKTEADEPMEVDESMIEERQPAKSAFADRLAARRAKLKPAEAPAQAGTTGQFQHFFEEAAGKGPAASEQMAATPAVKPTLMEKITAIDKELGLKSFLTPAEQAQEKAQDKTMVIESLKKADLSLDIEGVKKLRQGTTQEVGDRLVALAMAPQAEQIIHVLKDVAPIKQAQWFLTVTEDAEHRIHSPEKSLYTNKKLSPAELKQLQREEGTRRSDLKRLAGTKLTAAEEAGYDALRAYEDYAVDSEPEARLPEQSLLETTLALSNNQKKIARGLLESYQRYSEEQTNKKKPVMSLEKFVADNRALTTKKTEREDAVRNLRIFFGLEKAPEIESPITSASTLESTTPLTTEAAAVADNEVTEEDEGEVTKSFDKRQMAEIVKAKTTPEEAPAQLTAEQEETAFEKGDITAAVKDFLKELQKDPSIKKKKLLPTLEGFFDSIRQGHVDKAEAASELALLIVDDNVPPETVDKIQNFLKTYYPKSVAPTEADLMAAVRRLRPKADLHVVPTSTKKVPEATKTGLFGGIKRLFRGKKQRPSEEITAKTPTDGDGKRAA